LLLQRPFQVPINLSHETKPRNLRPNLLGGPLPEGLRPAAPGSFEDVRQNEHGHIAAQAVTLTADPQQFSDQCLLRRSVAVVKLQRIRPARKVGIAPIGQHEIALLPLHPDVVLRSLGQVVFASGNVIFGVLFDPRVIGAGVIGNKVQHQLQAAFPQAVAKTCQGRVPAQRMMGGVPGDREAGSRDVFFAQIRQSLLEFSAPLGIAA
jgi:hypothetical protein